MCFALGRTIATDYYVMSLLHSAGGRMFDAANKSQVVFDSPAAVETFEFIAELFPTMPPGAVGLHVPRRRRLDGQGSVGHGLLLGPRRSAARPRSTRTSSRRWRPTSTPRHPKTGKRLNWNDFQGWAIPKENNPYVAEVKAAVTHLMTSRDWQIKYAQSLVPNVSPVFQDVAQDPRLAQHPFFADQAPHDLRVLRRGAQARVELRQRAAAGHQPAGGHRPRPQHPRAGHPAGDHREEVAGRGREVDARAARGRPPGTHPAGTVATLDRVETALPGRRSGLSDRQLGVLFLLPFLGVSLAFVVYPAVESVRLAFYSKLPFRQTLTFVGLDNFRYVLDDPVFWASARQAVVWTAASIVLQTVLGVAVALLLNEAVRGINVFRGLLLFPYMVPTVVIALVGGGCSIPSSAS